VKLGDFGIVRAALIEPHATRRIKEKSATFLPSKPWEAALDARSDLFSLAVVVSSS
jgi:hypothetical protein